MTDDEKRKQMDARNQAIVAYYNEGNNPRKCASKFGVGRQRVLQILQKLGAWKPYVKSDRTKHVGVVVSEETKGRLHEKADEKGMSVSQFAADALERAVAE